jgi:hypothetical protein
MARTRHQHKEIAAAVQYALSRGWSLTRASARAHVWGRLFCPRGDRDGCIINVHSTPRVPENHADDIRRKVERCRHTDSP